MRRPLSAAFILAALLAQPVAVVAEVQAGGGAVRLAGERQEVILALTGGLPQQWRACAEACAGASDHRAMLFVGPGPGGGQLAWSVPGDPAAEQALAALEFTAAVPDGANGTAVVLTARDPYQGIRLVHSYQLKADGSGLLVNLQVPAGAVLRLVAGADLVPERMPGLGGWYNKIRAVLITPKGQSELGSGDDGETHAPLAGGSSWAGVRSRFWAFLLLPDSALPVAGAVPPGEMAEVRFGEPASVGRSVAFTAYAGPVERSALAAVAPELTGLLFAAIWDWLRLLSFALLAILRWWQGLVGNWGVAIILLSLTVKVLMWPLTRIADRWQAEVNRIQSLLQPELSAIRASSRGEEAHERTLAAYRKHGVSPYYTFRSLAGFLIQIPVFIAAFDMLGENFGLSGASFLWIPDLALPDRFAMLPAAIPFFGSHLNLVPLLMTACTLLAARLEEAPSLAQSLRTAQRLRLYAMAVLFFVLLYTFPAGMVLYWTTNNLLHLLKVAVLRLRAGRPGADGTRVKPA